MLRMRAYTDEKQGNRAKKENCNKIEISPFHIHTMGDVDALYATDGEYI